MKSITILTLSILFFLYPLNAEENYYSNKKLYNLRRSYKELSVTQVQAMPNMQKHEKKKKKKWGFYGHCRIQHDYEAKSFNGDNVVIDHATGLMWHQSGSMKSMTLKKGKKWINKYNNMGYARYNDWRLPTLEEAASLLEADKKSGTLYIDQIFDRKQSWIMTGDTDNLNRAWIINFKFGRVNISHLFTKFFLYVRPVRSMTGESVATNKVVRKKQVIGKLSKNKKVSDGKSKSETIFTEESSTKSKDMNEKLKTTDSLDVMLTIVEERAKQARQLEEAKRKEKARQLEEAKRKEKAEKEGKRIDKLKIELARKEAIREDIRKYIKIVASEYGKDMKEAAWDILVSRYPKAKGLAIGDISGFDRLFRLTTLLRSSYRNLSISQVQSMANISIREKEDNRLLCHSTIDHSYQLGSINGDNVVIDHATELMWHQSGSDNSMLWNEAKNWVMSLNSRGYAGYHDWRLPTLEEAASLLESSKKNGLYIDSAFSNKQEWISTGDSDNRYGSERMWYVSFQNGRVIRSGDSYIINYVRPVRSMTGSINIIEKIENTNVVTNANEVNKTSKSTSNESARKKTSYPKGTFAEDAQMKLYEVNTQKPDENIENKEGK